MKQHDKLIYEFDTIRQNMSHLRNVRYSLWNSLITFNGILIGAFAIIVTLKKNAVLFIDLIILLVVPIFSIILFIFSFVFTYKKVEKDVFKELDIFRSKMRNTYPNDYPQKISKTTDSYKQGISKLVSDFFEKYSANLALVLTVGTAIYFGTKIFCFFN